MPILHHTFNIQIFHRNEAWFLLHYFVNRFVFIILSDFCYTLMKHLYL